MPPYNDRDHDGRQRPHSRERSPVRRTHTDYRPVRQQHPRSQHRYEPYPAQHRGRALRYQSLSEEDGTMVYCPGHHRPLDTGPRSPVPLWEIPCAERPEDIAPKHRTRHRHGGPYVYTTVKDQRTTWELLSTREQNHLMMLYDAAGPRQAYTFDEIQGAVVFTKFANFHKKNYAQLGPLSRT